MLARDQHDAASVDHQKILPSTRFKALNSFPISQTRSSGQQTSTRATRSSAALTRSTQFASGAWDLAASKQEPQASASPCLQNSHLVPDKADLLDF
jgi:hypothetical protein